MASNKADWSLLRGMIIAFGVCLLAAGAMLSASYYFKQNMERQYQASHGQFRSASQQYLAVDEEERIIEQFYPEFVRMHQHGLLGDERRLSWLESLRNAGVSIKIPELNYSLDAQRKIELDYPLNLGTYDVFASSMNLSLGLLHEGDLFRLLNVLEREALGQYSVRQCKLTNRAIGGKIEIDSANLHAECTLEWLTVDLPGGQGIDL